MSTGLVVMNDAVIRSDLWVPIVIRVAWELHLAKIDIRPNILHAACIHVFSHLEADVSVETAERKASIYVSDFINILHKKSYQRPQLDPDHELEFSAGWRKVILNNLNPKEQRVFWFVYSDGLELKKTARKMGVGISKIEKACQKIRICARRIASKENIDVTDWSDTRLDKSIQYIANMASNLPLEPADILSKKGKRLINKCPRIRRAYLLLKHGILSERDLQIPTDNELIERQTLLVLMLHPDKRKFAKILNKALAEMAVQIDTDAWLIDEEDIEEAEEILSFLAEEASPPRQYLRGAMVSGPGEWFDDVLLGPLPIHCLDATRSRAWGAIDGIVELPQPLPPPPKSTSYWIVAAVTAIFSLSSWAWALSPVESQYVFPIQAEFSAAPESVDIRFDVSDNAHLTIVRLNNHVLTIDEEYSYAKKGTIATGDGRYYLRVDAPRIAVISSQEALVDLKNLLFSAQNAENPLEDLERQIKQIYPNVDIVLSPELEQY